LKNANKRIHIFPPQNRVVVIGDIHGDFQAAIKCLVLAKVIETPATKFPATHSTQAMTEFFNTLKWCGGSTYVVQLGDQIDRVRPQNWDTNNIAMDSAFDDEGSSLELFYLFTYLDKQAQRDGGRVICLLGNHEIMNVDGDFRYVSKGEFHSFAQNLASTYYRKCKYPYHSLTLKKNAKILRGKTATPIPDGYRERLYAFAPTGMCSNLFAENYYTVVQVGRWLFCHGGPTFETLSKYNVELLNNVVAFYLLGLDTDDNDISRNYFEIVSPRDRNNDGILWTREYSDVGDLTPLKEEKMCEKIDKVFKAYNAINNPSTPVQVMAVGHTPQFQTHNGINAICGGRVWRCDVGMSKAFGEVGKDERERRPQVLEIINDKQVKILG
jgi:hypothetical protein